MKIIRNTSIVAVTFGTVLLLSGCGTTKGYKQADKTGVGIAEFRDEITKGKAAIDATMKSLSDVAATADIDPRKAFEQFTKDVAKLESTANSIKKRAENMRAQGEAYFKQWEAELAQVNSPEIRSLAEERKTELKATFESIRQYTEPLKEQFAPWMSNLKDLDKYLANDLTIAGVNAAKPLFSKTTNEGLEVQKAMDALIAELNTLAATLTPASQKK